MGVFLSACEEEKNDNRIQGVVNEYPTYAPISGVSMELYIKKQNQGSINNSYEYESSTQSDAGGSFIFRFDAVMASRFKIVTEMEGYYSKELLITPNDIIGEYQANTTLVKTAGLDLHIVNVYPDSEDDEIQYRLQGFPDACDECPESGFRGLFGMAIDTTLHFNVAGNDSIIIDYTVTKGGTQYHVDSLFIPDNQNITHSIPY